MRPLTGRHCRVQTQAAKLHGIFIPNIVPFHDDQTVNEGELRRYISWLIDKGVTGFYPEGFREGGNLRGFNAGRARQPMSPTELTHFNSISGKLACLLADCGFAEAAAHCSKDAGETHSCGESDSSMDRADVEKIVRSVVFNYTYG